ncbi:hypothetical protein [Janthinobacterium sp. HH107]|uniref:hypothetical protein n=1 Tax=Janthinobacterium sp. HH107 TaxID=1537279 RepID=UPI00114D38A2|nr:hypothetical protein [Janthinobacterium sp. HH107]
MIEILHPMEFELPCPLPIEMSIILNSVIEKYFVHDITAGDYVRAAEGFFRSVKDEKIIIMLSMYWGKRRKFMMC